MKDELIAPPPAFAPAVWSDNVHIFVQFPLGSVVYKYPLTEGGLHKALKLIPSVTNAPGYITGGSNLGIKALPKVKVAAKTVKDRIAKRLGPVVKESASAIVKRRFFK